MLRRPTEKAVILKPAGVLARKRGAPVNRDGSSGSLTELLVGELLGIFSVSLQAKYITSSDVQMRRDDQ